MGHRSEFIGREGPKCSSPFVRPCNTLVVHSTPSQVWSGSPATQNFRRDATASQGELGRCEGWNALSPCLQAPGRCQDLMVRRPDSRMRYSGGEAEVIGDDIRRFAAEFDPPPRKNPSSKGSPLRAGIPQRPQCDWQSRSGLPPFPEESCTDNPSTERSEGSSST
jgi:hypothetical protein